MGNWMTVIIIINFAHSKYNYFRKNRIAIKQQVLVNKMYAACPSSLWNEADAPRCGNIKGTLCNKQSGSNK